VADPFIVGFIIFEKGPSLKKVFEFFVQQHILATLFTISILMLGLNTARTLKREQLPEVDLGEMIITTNYPGASPEDVELNVTSRSST
jgi:multidrug efflux pump subunit AcrB